jgi:hypothetical protein
MVVGRTALRAHAGGVSPAGDDADLGAAILAERADGERRLATLGRRPLSGRLGVVLWLLRLYVLAAFVLIALAAARGR